MAEGLRRDANVDPVGRVEQQVAPQEAEDGVEHQRDSDADRQHVERRIALVHQHLVDDELEEDRRDEGQRVEHDGRDGDVGEQPPLAHQLGDEPAEAETLRCRDRPPATLHEQRRARPQRAEFLLATEKRLRLRSHRVENSDRGLVLARADHLDPIAVGKEHDGRIRRAEATRSFQASFACRALSPSVLAMRSNDDGSRLLSPMAYACRKRSTVSSIPCRRATLTRHCRAVSVPRCVGASPLRSVPSAASPFGVGRRSAFVAGAASAITEAESAAPSRSAAIVPAADTGALSPLRRQPSTMSGPSMRPSMATANAGTARCLHMATLPNCAGPSGQPSVSADTDRPPVANDAPSVMAITANAGTARCFHMVTLPNWAGPSGQSSVSADTDRPPVANDAPSVMAITANAGTARCLHMVTLPNWAGPSGQSSMSADTDKPPVANDAPSVKASRSPSSPTTMTIKAATSSALHANLRMPCVTARLTC